MRPFSSYLVVLLVTTSVAVACKQASSGAKPKATPRPPETPYVAPNPTESLNGGQGSAPQIVSSSIPPQVRAGEMITMQMQVSDVDNDLQSVVFIPANTQIVDGNKPFVSSGQAYNWVLQFQVPANMQPAQLTGTVVATDQKGLQSQPVPVSIAIVANTTTSSGNSGVQGNAVLQGIVKPVLSAAMQALMAKGIDCTAPKTEDEAKQCRTAQAAGQLGNAVIDIFSNR